MPPGKQQSPWGDLQGAREPLNVSEADVPLAALHRSDIRPVKAGLGGQCLLREPGPMPGNTKVPGEELDERARLGARHDCRVPKAAPFASTALK